MKDFLHNLRSELRGLLHPLFLLPLLIVIGLTVGAFIMVNDQVEFPPKFAPIALIDNDNTPETSAISSWLDTSDLMVQRFFNKKPSYIRDDIRSMDMEALVEFPSGFSAELKDTGTAKIHTYLFMNDLSVKSALAEDTIQRALANTNRWALNNKYNKTGSDAPVQSVSYLVSGKHFVKSADPGFFKYYSAISVNAEVAIMIFLLTSFLLMMFKSNSRKDFFSTVSSMISALLPALFLSGIYIVFFQRYIFGNQLTQADPVLVDMLQMNFGLRETALFVLSLIIACITAMSIPLAIKRFKNFTVRILLATLCIGLFLLLPFAMTTVFDPDNMLVNLLPFTNTLLLPANGILKNFNPIIFGLNWQIILLAIVLIVSRIVTIKIYMKKDG